MEPSVKTAEFYVENVQAVSLKCYSLSIVEKYRVTFSSNEKKPKPGLFVVSLRDNQVGLVEISFVFFALLFCGKSKVILLLV